MTFTDLPTEIGSFLEWDWSQIEPFFRDLESWELDASNVEAWLRDWSQLGDLLIEVHARLRTNLDSNTSNPELEQRYNRFLDGIYPHSQAAQQKLKEKILRSNLKPAGFEVPLSKIQLEAAIYHPDNLTIITQETKLATKFNQIIGAQTVTWQGEEVTLQQVRRMANTDDRLTRETLWRLAAERQLGDRQALNQLWMAFMELRWQLAENAGMPDYLEYRWRQLLRQDYTPMDGLEFQEAIELAAVPAASRVYQKYCQSLGLKRLRPWDLDQDLYPLEFSGLPDYGSLEKLQNGCGDIFLRLDPQLGGYYHRMKDEGFLDLENRKGKAPGGYCMGFPVTRQSFIFMNATGQTNDVRTLLHEAGHAFHNFERFELPFMQQRMVGLEFAEVASMGMELLTLPYLVKKNGGFYSEADARRYQIAQLEHILVFWPYMAVVDAFQHWVYRNHKLAFNPDTCDAKWSELWQRFLPGIDWSDLENEAATGWQRKQHIFRAPLYYLEYGLAQLGAVQVWRGAIKNAEEGLRRYRYALSLGGTVTLPELYQAAGGKLAFDRKTLAEAVDFIEVTLSDLERADRTS